eukprot:m.425655 g.425655  ORF g.425655 m.425655 type:complete len:107 (+) comp53675_c0_seq1:553-873(+)
MRRASLTLGGVRQTASRLPMTKRAVLVITANCSGVVRRDGATLDPCSEILAVAISQTCVPGPGKMKGRKLAAARVLPVDRGHRSGEPGHQVCSIAVRSYPLVGLKH